MRKLRRYPDRGMIAGVCEGFGEYLGVDAPIIRIVWLLLALGLGVGVLAYIVCWIAIPEAEKEEE